MIFEDKHMGAIFSKLPLFRLGKMSSPGPEQCICMGMRSRSTAVTPFELGSSSPSPKLNDEKSTSSAACDDFEDIEGEVIFINLSIFQIRKMKDCLR